MTLNFNIDDKFSSYFDLDDSSESDSLLNQDCTHMIKELYENYNKLNIIKNSIKYSINEMSAINNKTEEVNEAISRLEDKYEKLYSKLNKYMNIIDNINLKILQDIKSLDNKNI
jgi:uncharacterized coiled-coil DUF342 family protein